MKLRIGNLLGVKHKRHRGWIILPLLYVTLGTINKENTVSGFNCHQDFLHQYFGSHLVIYYQDERVEEIKMDHRM